MRDFTLDIYRQLLEAFAQNGYTFQTFEEFLKKPSEKTIILRHDIDDRKENALLFSEIENKLNITASYYFRILKKSYDPQIINKIVEMGHEIGFHYEDLSLAKGDMKMAISLFKKHLKIFRQHYPVKTICMHGSPLSKYDNRDIWKVYNYHDYDLTGEPYFDIDFNKVLYLTDTGRCWNARASVVRDKVIGPFNFSFTSTPDIIQNIHQLPPIVMVTTHPQRWDNRYLPWFKELVLQNVKNKIKQFLYKN